MSGRRLDLSADLAGRAGRIATGHALADAAIAANDVDALRRELDALRQTHAGELSRERERVEAAERECVGVDRIISAWESIARAYRIDPSPANAERIATLATCAADVRDDAIAQRDAARADAAGLRRVSARVERIARSALDELAPYALPGVTRALDALTALREATPPDAATQRAGEGDDRECGHPVEMHRGADRCGAHGCGCDRNAEEAGWSP